MVSLLLMTFPDLNGFYFKNNKMNFEAFQNFCKIVQNEKCSNIITIRSDHGGEFENASFKTFFD